MLGKSLKDHINIRRFSQRDYRYVHIALRERLVIKRSKGLLRTADTPFKNLLAGHILREIESTELGPFPHLLILGFMTKGDTDAWISRS